MITQQDIEDYDPRDRTPYDMVKEYHETVGAAINEDIKKADNGLKGLRLGLIAEEFQELCEEFEKATYEPEKMLKELSDLVYVAYGMAVSFGWNLDMAVLRVHENNMGRMYQEDGTIQRREDGKIIKNPNYPAVELGDLV